MAEENHPEELPVEEPPLPEVEPPPPAVEAPLPIPHVHFALNPGSASLGIINYASRDGQKYYNASIAALSSDSPFDCTPDGLYHFLGLLKVRARTYRWYDGIMEIPDDPEDPLADTKNILEQYGEIDMSEIRTFEESYIDQNLRVAQDTHALYQCLIKSLSKEALEKIMLYEEEYQIDDRGSGNLLLKTIIRESYLDTNATTSQIRLKLSKLDEYLPTVGYDISKFNQYVMNLTQGLSARGESTEDLLVNLFKGYLSATDKAFVAYVERKQEDYEEGTSYLTPKSLMSNAKGKYSILKDKGKWNAPSMEEEKLLALTAHVKSLEKQLKKKGTDGKGDKKKGNRDLNKNKGTGPKSYTKGKGAAANKKPAWLLEHTPPKEGNEKVTREWNRFKYHWCHKTTGGKCDGKWRVHLPSKCEGKSHSFKRNDGSTKADSGRSEKKVKLSKAYEAAMDDESGATSDEFSE